MMMRCCRFQLKTPVCCCPLELAEISIGDVSKFQAPEGLPNASDENIDDLLPWNLATT